MQRSALELARASCINLDRQNRTDTQFQQSPSSPVSGPIVVVRRKRQGTGPVTIITGAWDDGAYKKMAVEQKLVSVRNEPMTAFHNGNGITNEIRMHLQNGKKMTTGQQKRLLRGPDDTTGFWKNEDFLNSNRDHEKPSSKEKLNKKRLIGGPITGFWKDDNISKEDLDNDLDSYMAGASGGLSRVGLDQDLEKYMKARAPTTNTDITGKDVDGGPMESCVDDGNIEQHVEVTKHPEVPDGTGFGEVTRDEAMAQDD